MKVHHLQSPYSPVESICGLRKQFAGKMRSSLTMRFFSKPSVTPSVNICLSCWKGFAREVKDFQTKLRRYQDADLDQFTLDETLPE